MSKFKRDSVLVDGTTISYLEAGSGNVVLFLHGGRLQASTFKSHINFLSKKYRVIAPDLPGHGHSSTPTCVWGYADCARMLTCLLRAQGVTDYSVVGYSMGAAIGFYLATSHFQPIKLIAIDASGVYANRSPQIFDELRRLLFYILHPKYIATLIALIYEYCYYTYRMTKTHTQSKYLQRKSVFSDFESIQCRTWCIWGSNDWLIPSRIGKLISSRLKYCTYLEVPGIHDWPLYNSSQFNKVMEYIDL